MRQARAQMVAGAVEKNLRFIFQAAERARMNDARTIPLKFGAIGVTRLTSVAVRAIRPIFEQRTRALCAPPPPFVRASSILRSFIRSVEEAGDFG